MFGKLKKIGVILWAVVASVFAVAVFVLSKRQQTNVQKNIEKEAEDAKEKTKKDIENTAAGELVDSACNADELRRERESIAERFRAEVRHRINEKLHGTGSAGTP